MTHEGVYGPSDFISTEFAEYVRGTFGMPNVTVRTFEEGVDDVEERTPFMASEITPGVAKLVNRLGFPVNEDYFGLNDKALFQFVVEDTLGPEFTTNPIVIGDGSDIESVVSHAALKIQKDKRAVIRIPNTEIAPGAGRGVLFAQDVDEIVRFLQKVEGVLDGNTLQTNIMVEDFLPSDASPSTTFYINDNGSVLPLAINYQILEGSKFIAATNVLPK